MRTLNKNIHFVVYGKAKSKDRPRFDSKHGITYTPKKTINYENEIKSAYIEVAKGRNVFGDAPVLMVVVEYKVIPKSFTKKKRQMALNDEMFPTTPPDYDNVAKIVSDALNNIAYKDDKQVIAFSDKIYSKNDMAYLEVFMVEREKNYKKQLMEILECY